MSTKLGVGALLGSLGDQLRSVSASGLMRDDTESTLISTG